MKISNTPRLDTARDTWTTTPGEGWTTRWNQFWFTPTDPWRLHLFRILTGTLIFVWLLTFLGHQEALFGLEGFFDNQAHYEAQDPRKLPEGPPAPIGWSLIYLTRGNPAAINYLYFAALAVVALFTLGITTRLTGVATWVMTVSFLANPAITYDADYLLVILAFYLALGYLFYGLWSRALSPLGRVLDPIDNWLLGNDATPTFAGNIVLRLVQIHFIIIVLTGALHKTQSGIWWSGVGFWFPMHEPFHTTMADILKKQSYGNAYLIMISLGQYLMVAWQIGLPFFAFRQGFYWRVLLIGGAALGWIGSLLIFKQPLFGPIYMIGCLSFLSDDEWLALRTRFGRGQMRKTTESKRAQEMAKT